MSLRTVTWAWRNSSLFPYQKLLLLALADRADCDDVCKLNFPGWARDTGIDFEDLEDILQQLEAKRLVKFIAADKLMLCIDGRVAL